MPRPTHTPVEDFWDWLLVFRAVAEREHLRNAAAALDVSPGAVSRTVRLLEDALGYELCERSVQGMALTPAGKRLLTGVRKAVDVIETSTAASSALAKKSGRGRRKSAAGRKKAAKKKRPAKRKATKRSQKRTTKRKTAKRKTAKRKTAKRKRGGRR